MSSITFLLSFLHTNFESAVTNLVSSIVLCWVKQISVAAVFQKGVYALLRLLRSKDFHLSNSGILYTCIIVESSGITCVSVDMLAP